MPLIPVFLIMYIDTWYIYYCPLSLTSALNWRIVKKNALKAHSIPFFFFLVSYCPLSLTSAFNLTDCFGKALGLFFLLLRMTELWMLIWFMMKISGISILLSILYKNFLQIIPLQQTIIFLNTNIHFCIYDIKHNNFNWKMCVSCIMI